MLNLPNVTLCVVDTAHHVLSAMAIRHCLERVNFGKVVFISDRPEFCDPVWEMHRIKTFSDYEEFNKFMLKHVYFHIDTEFTLIVQFDGFILNTDMWTDEFLQYDYIGAPWPCDRKEFAVGTGGFSLRSKKLLKALQDDRIQLPKDQVAEDLCFCRTYKSYLEIHHGIRYASVELATSFAYESGPKPEKTFGFHGLMMMADVYPPGPGALFMIDNLQPYLMKNPMTAGLATQYAHRHQEEEAARLIRRIAESQSLDDTYQRLQARGAKQEMLDVLKDSWQRYAA